jgi:hypothetical protein
MKIDFSGVWRGNLQKSKLSGALPKALLVRIDHQDPVLVMEMIVTKADDIEDRLFFRGLTTGEEVDNSVHGIQVRSCSTWVGVELVIESKINLGERESVLRDYWSLSNDGRMLTMEHRDDALAGQITLLERTGVSPSSYSG